MGKTSPTPRPARKRRPANGAALRNSYLEQNLFGKGATLRDVAQHFGLSLDQVKRLSAKEHWPAQLRERQEAEAERRHREVCRRKEIDAVEERLEMLADRDLGRAVLRRKLEHYARHPEQLRPAEAIKLAEWVERTTQVAAGISSKVELSSRSDEVSRRVAAQGEAAANVTRIEEFLQKGKRGGR